MNYSVTQSVRVEIIAALLLALDYLKALLWRGRTSLCGINALPLVMYAVATIVSSLFVTHIIRAASSRKRLRQQQEEKKEEKKEEETQYPSHVGNPLQSGDNNNNNDSNRKNGINSKSNNARQTDRYSSGRSDEFFGTSRPLRHDDFDADGHVQMLLKHFRSSATTV
ncbi:hypothetical protein LSM04_009255 [Trypanosoma melophagium]|uniref:uncharacterized protein n=1 Tax=Trypanosoma melophagium TaxID=715481 RepID=UPI00351A45E0|nr:hypothetical protein LSM04_009255 [Trypanosoma melophagium]